MRITIWDLDYYYNKERNSFNADVMKIAGYHKQKGDVINFVLCKDDIYRPYDVYYIIKENSKTPNPPKDFFVNSKVKWYGKAFKARRNLWMSDEMIAARPDYLLYPNYAEKEHPYAQLRLFNDKAQLLNAVQDWTNTLSNIVMVTDTTMWYSDKKSIITALKVLQKMEKVAFLEPIWLQKLVSDKDIKEEFMKLKLSSTYKIIWQRINISQFKESLEFLQEFKKTYPKIGGAEILIDWRRKDASHWDNKENALVDFQMAKNTIDIAKSAGIKAVIMMPKNRLDTPYFFLFEVLNEWTSKFPHLSWIEFLIKKYGYNKTDTLYHPSDWSELFRDLLRQTWRDKTLMLHRWLDNYVSENEIPWTILESEFEYGI